MPSPFPGMDPYLEGTPWGSFHAALVDEMGRQLAPKVRPKYFVRVERRFVAGEPNAPAEVGVTARNMYPDVGVLRTSPEMPGHSGTSGGAGLVTAALDPPIELATVISARVPQRSLTILDAVERRLVAAIELLSPSNKRVGGGREEYLERRDNYLNGDVHLIEIDLLRRGARLPMRGVLPSVPYFAFLSRSGFRPMTGIWPIGLREPLPGVPVPLMAGDADVTLDLQAALSGAYDAFGFDLEIDYRQPPQVPLDADDAAWAAALLSGRG